MDRCVVCPSMALAMISQGTEQVVKVDLQTILNKVMHALGSRDAPFYTVYDCGPNGFRVSIKLHVAAIKIWSGQPVHHAVVEGENLPTRAEAVNDAVLKALKYLRDTHHTKILDYSSKVVDDITENRTIGFINSALYNVTNLVDNCGKVMQKCLELQFAVQGKESKSTGDNDFHRNKDVYDSFRDFMQMLIDNCNGKLVHAKETTKKIVDFRDNIVSTSTDKYNASLPKGHYLDVFVTCKDILEYVLTYIGAGKPQYTNGPNDEKMFDGEVVFHIPDIPGIECCGNIKIKGKSTRSRDAEEEAAFNALQFMEKKYYLKIEDFNYVERLHAEKIENSQVRSLDQLLHLGYEMKRSLADLFHFIATEKLNYSVVGTPIFSGPEAATKSEDYNFCFSAIEELEKYASSLIEESTSIFHELDKIYHQLEEIKENIGID